MKKALKAISVVIGAIAASVAYRYGGSEHGKRFVRPLAISLLTVLLIGYLASWHWSLILVAGLTYGACTTYFDFINKWLPVEDKDKEYWFNWALHGFFIGLAVLPYCFFEGHWLEMGLRTAFLTVSVALWSESFSNAVLEELGRGFLIVASLLFFLI